MRVTAKSSHSLPSGGGSSINPPTPAAMPTAKMVHNERKRETMTDSYYNNLLRQFALTTCDNDLPQTGAARLWSHLSHPCLTFGALSNIHETVCDLRHTTNACAAFSFIVAT
jgi:hypothetical protein